MAVVETKNFGPVPYDAEAALEFPRGLPGFEERRRFIALHFSSSDPLVYLQSLEDPALCFLAIPARALDPDYRLEAEAEDLEVVGLPRGSPRIPEEAWCLAVLSIGEEGPTANLLAPVVVNPRNRRCVQAIQPRSGYSHRHALCAEEAAACS